MKRNSTSMTQKRVAARAGALVLLAALFALTLGAMGLSRMEKARAETPVFERVDTFAEEYGLGSTLTVPAVTARIGDAEIQCGASLVCGTREVARLDPGQSRMRVRLVDAGQYVLIYFCSYEGKNYTDSYAFEVKDAPIFTTTLASEYKLGSDLPLDITAEYGGEKKKAIVKVNGEVVTSYRITSLNQVNVEYSAEFGGKEYSEARTIRVLPVSFENLFTGKGITSISANGNIPDFYRDEDLGTGVKIMAGETGTVVRYGNIIDMRNMKKNDPLIRFAPLSGSGYTALEDVYVRLTDAHDATNYIEWRYYTFTGTKKNNYVWFVYNNVQSAIFNEPGIRQGTLVNAMSTSYGVNVCATITLDIVNAAQATRKYRQCMVSMDYAERKAYVESTTPTPGMWEILDLDNPNHVGGVGNVWKGFTTGEAWLELRMDGNGNSGVIVTEVAGQSLSGTGITDTGAPAIFTEYDTDTAPRGFVGKAYTVPAVTAVPDLVYGMLDSSEVSVAVEGPSGGTVQVTGGKFTPAETGVYKIKYSATDNEDNVGTHEVDVTVGSAETVSAICDLPESGTVGTSVMLPDVTVVGMSTLMSKSVEYYYNNEKLDEQFGDDLFLPGPGTLEVRYSFTDYVGNKESGTKSMQVTVADEPIITVKGMPYTAIRGKRLVLPDFTAVDYRYDEGNALRYPERRITVNGHPVDVRSRVYSVTAADKRQLEIVYSAGSAEEKFTLPVIDASMLSDYLTASSSAGWVKRIDKEDYTALGFGTDLQAKFVNPTVVNAFNGCPIEFDVPGEEGTIKLTLTDFYRPHKSVSVTVNKADKTYTLSDGKSYALPDGRVALNYVEREHSITDYAVFERWEDGSPFDGFAGGTAILSFELSGYSTAELRLHVIGKSQMGSIYSGGVPLPYTDNGEPTIVLSQSVNGQSVRYGGTLVLPSADAWSAMSGRREVRVGLGTPSGAEAAIGLDGAHEHTFTVNEYGVWQVRYTVYNDNGRARAPVAFPITIRSDEPPKATVLTEVPATVAVGGEIAMPYTRVTGVGKIETYWSLTDPYGKVRNYRSGERAAITVAGRYRLTLVVKDDWNYTVKSFDITAEVA